MDSIRFAGRSLDRVLEPMAHPGSMFRPKRADRIKLLVWDQTGMVLVHKRLEDGKFVWPQVQDGVMPMFSAQMSALFEDEEDQETVWATVCPANDWRLVRTERARRPLAAG